MSAADLVRRLTALAREQREAAVAFDTETMDRLTRQRADTLFELKVVLAGPLTEASRDEVRQVLPAYQREEARLCHVVGAVAQALRPRPRGASTYGRRGRLRRG